MDVVVFAKTADSQDPAAVVTPAEGGVRPRARRVIGLCVGHLFGVSLGHGGGPEHVVRTTPVQTSPCLR
jgi:hypothetical protein